MAAEYFLGTFTILAVATTLWFKIYDVVFLLVQVWAL